MRGYKGDIEKQNTTHLFQKEAPWSLVGDEACLIARNVPTATMLVGKNKVAGAKMADAKGLQVLIVDDGMQHIGLGRNFEIVMLDSQNPFGYGHLLPRGLLREPLSALKRASLIVITCRNGTDISPNQEAVIRNYTTAPICKVRYKPLGFFDVHDVKVDIAQDAKVGLFCAIAKPDQFVTTIRRLGLNPVYSHFLPDHATFAHIPVDEAKASGAHCLICTEKDIVKLPKEATSALPIYYLKVAIEMMTPEVWEEATANMYKVELKL